MLERYCMKMTLGAYMLLCFDTLIFVRVVPRSLQVVREGYLLSVPPPPATPSPVLGRVTAVASLQERRRASSVVCRRSASVAYIVNQI